MSILLTNEEIEPILEGEGKLGWMVSDDYDEYVLPDDFAKSIARAQLKKVVDELDIRFIINMLKQDKESIWQKRGRDICSKQIDKLEALLKEIE